MINDQDTINSGIRSRATVLRIFCKVHCERLGCCVKKKAPPLYLMYLLIGLSYGLAGTASDKSNLDLKFHPPGLFFTTILFNLVYKSIAYLANMHIHCKILPVKLWRWPANSNSSLCRTQRNLLPLSLAN